MASLNSVTLIGNLGKDPEMRNTQNNTVCNFPLATKEVYQKDGNRVEQTEWHRVVVWGKMASNCAQYLKKGSCVYIEGKLQTRKWKNEKTGLDQYSTDIVAKNIQFLDRKPKEDSQPYQQPQAEPGFMDEDFTIPF